MFRVQIDTDPDFFSWSKSADSLKESLTYAEFVVKMAEKQKGTNKKFGGVSRVAVYSPSGKLIKEFM
jgi:hypothetical protein